MGTDDLPGNVRPQDDDFIDGKVKPAVRQLIVKELTDRVEEMFRDIMQTSYHIVQTGQRSVIYKVLEQVMLDMLQKDVIEDIIDTHIKKPLDTRNAAEKFYKEAAHQKSLHDAHCTI